ncbi:MAG: MCP four helix bundle domain-containing protein [Comamonas sp.]|nr:MCP four helix bundle domain-containing protein [Comamonas sp.]
MQAKTGLTVVARLYLGFGLIVAVLVVVTVIAMLKVQAINSALRANSEEHVLIQRHAINFRGSAHDRAIAIRDVVLSTTPERKDAEVATIAKLADFYAQSAAPLRSLVERPGADPQLAQMYAAIARIEAQAVATTQDIIKKSQAQDIAAETLLWEQAKPLYTQWLAAINVLIDFEEARIQAENATALQESGSFLSVMLAALAVALVLAAAIAWQVSRSIVRQLGAEPQALAQVAQAVAQGDLRTTSFSRSAPQGSVLASLFAMQHSLASVVNQVRQASNAVTSGASEITSGNTGLLERTEAQAAHLEQTSTSMEQMTGIVHHTASSARQASSLATSASQAAHKGGEAVEQVQRTMQAMTSSSQKMADIIGVIDSIAFQTNILALNAAVEAARAGEQGRGFAVVASEVRALAQRSADAAHEIKDLIDASVSKVNEGEQLVGNASQTMTDIVTQAQRVASLIAEISASTVEQSDGIDLVNTAIGQLDQTTQQNAAMVEESAAAAQTLQQQAQLLAQAVSVFRLNAGSELLSQPQPAPQLEPQLQLQ